MPREASAHAGGLVWRAALGGALIVALAGGLATTIALIQTERQAEGIFAVDTAALGDTVARSIALQVERAVGYGIPFNALPGIDAFLTDIATHTPGVAAITLNDAAGRTLARGALADSSDDLATIVRVPITVSGSRQGEVVVAASTATLAATRSEARLLTAAGVLAAAAVAAALSGLLAYLMLARPLRRLRANLAKVGDGDVFSRPDAAWAGASEARAVRAAFIARAERLDEARQTLEAYAAELRRADHDGSLTPKIEAALAGTGVSKAEPAPLPAAAVAAAPAAAAATARA